MRRILFLTTAHRYDDDRIFYHQAKSLSEEGFQVKICSLSSDFIGNKDGIEIEAKNILTESTASKITFIKNICENFQPDLILASEPLAIIASKKWNRKVPVIYDVTEWYPSTRMLKPYSGVSKFLHAAKFFLINLYAGFRSRAFIFGEKTKRFPLHYFYFFKQNLLLPYFPSAKFIKQNILKIENRELVLCYTGRFSEEKGFGNFLNVVAATKILRPDLKIKTLLVGTGAETDYFKDLTKDVSAEELIIKPYADFENFTESFSEAHICFDLRPTNFENRHCLPIKLFYYAAAGKPVIFSDLDAIRQHVEIDKFGFLVDAENAENIAKLISNYADNPALYHQHAENAHRLFQQKYSWEKFRPAFIDFVKTETR